MKCSFLIFGISALLASPLAAKPLVLDEYMSKEEQHKTGVDKLSFTQRVELEAWINRNFIPRAQEVEKQAPLTVSINIDNGHKLQLSDNSLWEIAPTDVTVAAAWILSVPVEIKPSNDPNYPFLIYNENSKTGVKAKKLSEGNPQPAPAPQPTPQ